MPIIHGDILTEGPVIDVMVGVSQPRWRLLQENNLPVPKPVTVRALIDTGASISGFSPRVFTDLGVSPVGKITIYTPSTSPDLPHECNLYDVILCLVANGRLNQFPGLRVIEADCWHPDEGVEALLGRDILKECFFQYLGPDGKFTLAF
jgi:hypothetical protein